MVRRRVVASAVVMAVGLAHPAQAQALLQARVHGSGMAHDTVPITVFHAHPVIV